jgi:hypothetical protein
LAISLTSPIIAIQILFSGFFLKKVLVLGKLKKLFIKFYKLIHFSENMPSFFLIFKYLSCINYGYNSIMINQWGKVKTIKCELNLNQTTFCVESGEFILKDLDLTTVT